jgi:hypothetical protein
MELRRGSLVMDIKAHSVAASLKCHRPDKKEWTCLNSLCAIRAGAFPPEILDYVGSYESNVSPKGGCLHFLFTSELNLDGRKNPIETVRDFGYRLDETNA